MKTKHYKTPSIKEVAQLLVALKQDIQDDCRCTDDADDTEPGMLVTIGASPDGDWNYQTGDNSYSGGAYGHRHWGLVYLYRNTNCHEAARECVREIVDSMHETEGAAIAKAEGRGET